MERKMFLRKAALMAVSMSTFGKVLQGIDEEKHGDCETTNDILGPFYRENSPNKSDLTFDGLEGYIIYLKGKVYKDDCTTLLKNATIEIWHCNTLGEYDNVSDAFLHRGLQKTTADGTYSFKTILPGKYLNGELYRPSHIHFRVTEPNSEELISQIYFKDDPHIKTDPWASKANANHRILPIIPQQTDGSLTIVFDIYLRQKK